jgi:hypothetical protein
MRYILLGIIKELDLMNKVNIANYVIYDLANRFHGTAHADMDMEMTDFVAETWHKKHFVSAPHGIKQHHNENLHRKFLI